jgi:hypothetical protein
MELIGHIGVDSGQMMLCDPCYIESHWKEENDFDMGASDRDEPDNTDFSYRGACETTLAKVSAGVLGNGIAAVCSTGFGDGSYPVYVEYSDEGEWGRRVKRMVIEFIGDEIEEDPEDACEDCGAELYGFNNGRQCPDCEQAEHATCEHGVNCDDEVCDDCRSLEDDRDE